MPINEEIQKLRAQPKDKKWILYKHTCNYLKIQEFLVNLSSLCGCSTSDSQRVRMQQIARARHSYSPRDKVETPMDAVNHMINTLEYWMFGHEEKYNENGTIKEKHFILSPLGQLFLKYQQKKSLENKSLELSKILFCQLYALQFPHPANTTSHEFQLFPFRLIFKLLSDKRLDFKLYDNEVEYILMFLKKVDAVSYEDVVREILILRDVDLDTMASLFKENENVFVKCVFEWQYTIRFLGDAKIFDITDGPIICRLCHHQSKGTHSPPTYRSAKKRYITLSQDLQKLSAQMLIDHSPFEGVQRFDDPSRSKEDVTKAIYGFYPSELLHNLGESVGRVEYYTKMSNLITDYSKHPDQKSAEEFEEVLTQAFNSFSDVKAEHIGGSGHTDVACIFKEGASAEKFAVDGKSTDSKLSLINAGRLRKHRKEIGAKYTIIITPSYVPAVKDDIEGEPIVILLASTFSEFIFNSSVNREAGVSYKDIQEIIVNNLGTDISSKVSSLTMTKFGSSLPSKAPRRGL